MELVYNPSRKNDTESFSIERKEQPYFGADWHYHEEYELLFTIKGNGVRIIGDHMDYFEDPELILMGKNTPHIFRNEKNSNNESVDYLVIKFGDFFEGNSLFTLPEMIPIKQLLITSKRGIKFSAKTIEAVRSILLNMHKAVGVEKILNLIRVLHILSTEENHAYLSNEDFRITDEAKREDRIQNVINYISENYTKDITLEDLAEVSYMTTNSFCRYFKSKTGKTAFQFIREYRINKACQLLINGVKSISDICYDTGFNSFSSFNRIFKSIKTISASSYRNKYAIGKVG